MWYLGVWRKEYRPSDIVAEQEGATGQCKLNCAKKERKCGRDSLCDQLNMAGHSAHRVPGFPPSDGVSQRCSVVLTSRKFEITRERVVTRRSKSGYEKGHVSGTSPIQALLDLNTLPEIHEFSVTTQYRQCYMLLRSFFNCIMSCIAGRNSPDQRSISYIRSVPPYALL